MWLLCSPPTLGGLCALLALFPQTVVAADKQPVHVVRAKVKSVGEKLKHGAVPATFEVVYVYSASGDLVGTTFTDYQYGGPPQQGSGGPPIRNRAPFAVDEEGLWEIQVVTRNGKTEHLPRVLSRKADNPDGHAAVVAWAERVEKVERAKPDERLALLKKYVEDSSLGMTGWALTRLGELDAADAGEYLGGLAAKPGEKLSVPLQITLDEVLIARQGADWQESKPRLAMLRAWVSGKPADKNVGWVLGRIDRSHQRQELTDAVAVELIRTAAENKEWPKESRRYAVLLLGGIAGRCANEDVRTAAYEWVFEQMRANEDIELRRAAADTLPVFPLYPARLKAVEEHLLTETDEKVAARLRAAVKKAKADK